MAARRPTSAARTTVVRKSKSKPSAPPAAHTDRVAVYFAALSGAPKERMRRIRALIRSVSPDAVEWFSYGIPGFRLHDKPFVWYAAFKEHVSLFPMTSAIRTAFARELEAYETSKGTVRFPHDRPLPIMLIKALVKARLKELRGRAD